MNIGTPFQQENPLAIALSQQNWQQEQMSAEERLRKQQAIKAALDDMFSGIMTPRPFSRYALSGAHAGNAGAIGLSDYF